MLIPLRTICKNLTVLYNILLMQGYDSSYNFCFNCVNRIYFRFIFSMKSCFSVHIIWLLLKFFVFIVSENVFMGYYFCSNLIAMLKKVKLLIFRFSTSNVSFPSVASPVSHPRVGGLKPYLRQSILPKNWINWLSFWNTGLSARCMLHNKFRELKA